MSFVAQEDEEVSIYMTLFGTNKHGADTCGIGNATDHVYVYKLSFSKKGKMEITFESRIHVDTGYCCDDLFASTGTNFEAGSGLWIRPNGRNRLSVLATEHYDSCNGKSRWGVSENWKFEYDYQ